MATHAPRGPAPPSKPDDDWREQFRAADYDDPWAPYVPFSEEALQISQQNYLHTIVPSVLEGTWRPRRHGMNLEPLLMLFRGVDLEELARSTEDEGGSASQRQGVEDDVLQDEAIAKARERTRWADTQTRFLCRMLDDLYRTGIRRESDRPRTERCHRAIGKLLTMAPENPAERGVHPDVTFGGLAPRAGAILRRMEQCSPPALLRQTPSNKTTSGENAVDRFFSVGSYQDVYPDYPRHLSQTKHSLPAPTRKIYNMVLKSYAKEAGPIRIAQQAEDVVWSMIVRAAMQQPSGLDEDGSSDGLLPSTENWNCVLECWSRSTDPDRAFHAYSFLRSWMEWNEQSESTTSTTGNPDAASFHLVLQSCLVPEDVSDDEEYQHRREMGSGVAVRLWKELPRSNVAPDSTTYHLVAQAICQTSELPSLSNSAALQALARLFLQCHRDAMVTPEITDLVKSATTESQFAQIQARLGNET
ncbi:hypothetical protein ACHAXT_005178 [Thalassiosira profunda]